MLKPFILNHSSSSAVDIPTHMQSLLQSLKHVWLTYTDDIFRHILVVQLQVQVCQLYLYKQQAWHWQLAHHNIHHII